MVDDYRTQVCDLGSGEVVNNGELIRDETGEDQDQVLFHLDDSSRIIQVSNEALKMFHDAPSGLIVQVKRYIFDVDLSLSNIAFFPGPAWPL